MTTPSTYPLRLPKSVKEAAEAFSKAEGTSLNQFVAIAVAEKIAALKTAAFFEDRRQRATPGALDALLSRTGGEPPRDGDELPEGYVSLAQRQQARPKATTAKPASKPRHTTRAKT